ncbi:guanylate kinase [Puniceicoccales bacterium CK1056]|uniref:Guanylate kinase n=1 Tax=Oceanipulchritudo coccoides TaxID=2706888 RepID=A0A6B2M372_9BACT|nr:guanylate kinase [Oceanipulchritudo coccoides]NDV62255.1 guanylate kinase [Oceanipulchritudo coccoides]
MSISENWRSMTVPPTASPIILIICGPAGSGKTTLCEQLLSEFPDRIERIVTTTSRQPRPGEVDGLDYHFLDEEVFKRRLENGDFIEWAIVHGRYYGSQKKHILQQLEKGKDLMLNIDIQGAQTFRKEPSINSRLAGGLHTIFIQPESLEQIRERLKGRGESEMEIERRLKSARIELQEVDNFEHVILSGTREADYDALRKLYLSLRK